MQAAGRELSAATGGEEPKAGRQGAPLLPWEGSSPARNHPKAGTPRAGAHGAGGGLGGAARWVPQRPAAPVQRARYRFRPFCPRFGLPGLPRHVPIFLASPPPGSPLSGRKYLEFLSRRRRAGGAPARQCVRRPGAAPEDRAFCHQPRHIPRHIPSPLTAQRRMPWPGEEEAAAGCAPCLSPPGARAGHEVAGHPGTPGCSQAPTPLCQRPQGVSGR